MNLLKCACCTIGMCSLFISCGPDCKDDPNLNADELSWIPYKGGETLIFKSVIGNYDTEIVGQKQFQINSIRDLEAEDHINCKYSSQELELRVGNFDFGIAHKNLDVTYTSPEYGGNIPDDGNLYEGPYHNISKSAFLISVVLNGKTFNNVYNYYGLYYSKQDGIVAFPGNSHDSLFVKIN